MLNRWIRRNIAILIIITMLIGFLPLDMQMALGADAFQISSVQSLLDDGTYLSPAKGTESGGTTLVIKGKGFENGVQVYIDEPDQSQKMATLISLNADEILVKTPVLWDRNQMNRPMAVIVKNANGQMVAQANGFRYIENPIITEKEVGLRNEIKFLEDNYGNITGREEQTLIYIPGQNFNEEIYEVKIGGQRTSIVEQWDTGLTAVIPENILAGNQYVISVKNKYGGQDVTESILLEPVTHNITSISDVEVVVGKKITIYGQGFNGNNVNDKKVSSVQIGDNPAQFNIISDTEIEATIVSPKDWTLQFQDIDLILANGAMVTLKEALKILSTPVPFIVERVTPDAGPTLGGTVITIIGMELDANMKVTIGGRAAADVKKVTPPDLPDGKTALEAITPKGEEGFQDVVVTNNLTGESFKLANAFNYISLSDALVVADISFPAKGYETGGEAIDIFGRNFILLNEHNDLYESGSFIGKDELILKTDVFTYHDPISDLDKRVIRERKLVATLAGQKAELQKILVNPETGNQTIRAKTPQVTLDPREATEVDVVVTVTTRLYEVDAEGNTIKVLKTFSENSKSPIQYTYLPVPSDPEITRVLLLEDYQKPQWPEDNYIPKGTVAGGTDLVIIGADFRQDPAVFIGENKATVTQIMGLPGETNGKPNGAIIVRTPPANNKGLVTIRVENKDKDENGGAAVKENAFEYVSNPQIINITPDVSPVSGDIYGTITGSDFMVYQDEDGEVTFPSVLIGGKSVKVREVWDEDGNEVDGKKVTCGTTIKFYIDTEYDNPGFVAVKIENPDGGQIEVANAFELKPVPPKSPVITNVEPLKGSVDGGEEIMVTGSNFHLEDEILVTIDGSPVRDLNVSSNGQILTGKTPRGSEGQKLLQVINMDDGGVATYTEAFEYVRIRTAPQITSIMPNHGGKGTTVYIWGQDFVIPVEENGQVISEGSHVYLGQDEISAEDIIVKDATCIQFKVPDLGRKPGEYAVIVTNPDTARAESSEPFRYQIPDSSPQIENIFPQRGPVAGGTIVTIEGTDFRTGIEVLFDGMAATILEQDKTTIIVKTPASTPGKATVMVVNYDGGSAIHEDAFEYEIPGSEPQIISVEPASGTAAGGDEMIINGRDFRVRKDEEGHYLDRNGDIVSDIAQAQPPEVLIGSERALYVKWISDTKLQVITPSSSGAGTKDVTVINDDLGQAILKNGFTYVQQSVSISAMAPKHGSAGTWVILKGNHFILENEITSPGSSQDILLSTPKTKVFMGDYQIPEEDVIVETGYQLKFKVPDFGENTGEYPVKVENPDGSTATSSEPFVFQIPDSHPELIGIEPGCGSTAGGTSVVIKGRQFLNSAEVYFDGNLLIDMEINEAGTEIIGKTPSGNPGMVDVTVVNYDGGSVTWMDGFTYKGSGSYPTIIEITPNTGSTQGGEEVVIRGTDFRTGAQVYFGQRNLVNQAEVIAFDKVQGTITVKTLPHDPGPCDIIIVNPDPSYGEIVFENGFTYVRTKPEKPFPFRAIPISDRVIMLQWAEAAGAVQYEIYGRRLDADTGDQFIGATGQLEYYVKNLTSNTRYLFKLRALNEHGVSAPFLEATAMTEIKNETEHEVDDSARESNYISFKGDRVIYTVGEHKTNRSSHVIDLDEREYTRTNKKAINVPLKVIEKGKPLLTIKTGELECRLDPELLDNIYFKRLSSREEEKAYVQILFEKVAGPDKSRLLNPIMSKMQMASPLIKISQAANIGRKSYAIRELRSSTSLIFYYDRTQIRNLDGLGLYYFNPALRNWEYVGGYTTGSRIQAQFKKMGYYGVFYRR